jgi:4-amino-4-deoxy-L-arabinose transferase-like glycosyltransferase
MIFRDKKINIQDINWQYFALFLLFLGAIYFPLFYHLDYLPIRLYDESRRAVNALEMARNGNPIVTFYDGKPDMWGKPPLPIWFMAISMHIFGFNELGLRLPSAFMGLGIIIMLYWFCHRYLKAPVLGIIVGLILVTSGGFIREHVVRTADYDVYLTFWLMLYSLSFFLFTESEDVKQRKKYLYVSAAAITLAVLTKSIAGLFFLPGLAIYALLRKQLLSILSYKHTYFAILGFLSIVGAYYLLRNALTPYYINAVMYNEVTGRFFETKEGHDHGLLFYLNNLYQHHFYPWIYLLLPAIVIALLQQSKLARLSLLLFLNCLILLTVISFSKTQLSWYDAPLIPCFSLFVAIPVYELFKKINPKGIQNWKSFALSILFISTVFVIPYAEISKQFHKPERNWKRHEKELYGYFMRKHPDLDNYFVCNIGYNAASKFYIDQFNHNGYNIGRFHPLKLQPPESLLLICEKNAKKTVREVHHVYPLMEWNRCELIKVTGNKRNYQVNVQELENEKK